MTSSLTNSSQYRESGVDWLGQIPAGWNVLRFRRVFCESSEVNGDHPVGTMLSISGYRGVEIKEYDDDRRRRTDEEVATYRIVRPGQLAVNTMWLNYGGLGVSDYEGYVSPAYRAYWIREGFDSRYLHHLMRSASYIEGYTMLLTGIRPNSLQLSRENLMSFPVLQPPLAEQHAIAEFLDRETAEIDAFIADQDELIGLLAERRAATISHAVKGSPDADVVQVRRIVSYLSQGWSPECESFPAVDGQWGVLKVGCVNGGAFAPEQNKALPAAVAPRIDLTVRAGDVLVSRGNTRELVGSAAVTDRSYSRLMVSDLLYQVRVDDKRVSPGFLALALGSRAARGQIESSAKGTSASMQKISQGDLLGVRIALPSLSSQGEIVRRVGLEVSELDAAIADAREAIALSRERRAALISAAVTGKIDVRNLGEVA